MPIIERSRQNQNTGTCESVFGYTLPCADNTYCNKTPRVKFTLPVDESAVQFTMDNLTSHLSMYIKSMAPNVKSVISQINTNVMHLEFNSGLTIPFVLEVYAAGDQHTIVRIRSMYLITFAEKRSPLECLQVEYLHNQTILKAIRYFVKNCEAYDVSSAS